MEALDAVLVDSSAIDRLLAAFSDPAIALAYGRQPPRHGAFPIEAHARLFKLLISIKHSNSRRSEKSRL